MKFVRGIEIVLLVFLGLTAFAGSVPMILHPGGNSSTLPLSTLQYSPFHSYLIPGILLFAANGLLALAVLRSVFRRTAHYPLWAAFQGCVLLVWLVSECWLLRAVIWLHYFYAGIAALLIAFGLILQHMEKQRTGFTAGTRPGTRSA